MLRLFSLYLNEVVSPLHSPEVEKDGVIQVAREYGQRDITESCHYANSGPQITVFQNPPIVSK
jgi:hypothetical protein